MKREIGEEKTGKERFTSVDILKRIPHRIQRDQTMCKETLTNLSDLYETLRDINSDIKD